MKNVKKIGIVLGIAIGMPLIVGTIFSILSDYWSWGQHVMVWTFPSTIFITIPLLIGMLNDDKDFKLSELGVKLLVITVIYPCAIFALIWEYSEPKAPDMNTWINICIRIMPFVLVMCTIGHYTRKYFWNKEQNK
ncbi:MAG: hypothetical protein WCL18_05275 [bacterium]